MKPNRLMVIASATASVVALLGGAALAQGGAGTGLGAGADGPAAAPAVPASGMGMGMGMGPGMRSGRGPYGQWGTDYTPGWSMMTQAERNEHRARMRSMTTYEECKAYIDQHHEQMAARAKERGGKALAQPRRDACARLKP